MHSSWWLLTFLLCISGAVPTGTASASAPPEPGTRIRLTAKVPHEKSWIGPLVSVANETVTMSDGDTTGALVAVPTRYITRFEISDGVHGHGWRGAGVGLVIGALVGAGVGYYATPADLEAGPGVYTTIGAVLGGVLGAVIGAPKAARNPSEHWRTLPLETLRATAEP